MRLSRNHVDYIAFLVHREMKANKRVVVKNPDLLVSIIRTELLANLQAEVELEREATEMVNAHRREVLQGGADYRRLVDEGKRVLARKRGIVI
jgi:hypothetical protein